MSQNVIRMPELSFTPDSKGLGHAYYTAMSKNSDQVAQIDGLTGEKDTFGQLLERSTRVAQHMIDVGIKPGDIICTCSFNHFNSGVPLIASMFIGAISTAIEPTSSLNDTVFLLKQVRPKMIFVQSDFVEKIRNVLSIIGDKVDVVVFGDDLPFLRRHQGADTFKPWEVKSLYDTATITFSSGTTGYPKGICHNHYTLICLSLNKTDSLALPNDLYLSYASPYWAVFLINFNCSILKGMTRLVYPRYDPTRAWEMFDYKVTLLFINTVQMKIMCNQGRPEHVNSDALTDLVVGGDVHQLKDILTMRTMFPNSRVHAAYGQTEIPHISFFDTRHCVEHVEMIAKKPLSVGTGLYGFSYKVVDVDSGEALGPNQHGELRIMTKQQTSGYYNVKSSDIWDSDGWLRTGDVGYYDEDQCFYVIGRIKEMFKYQEWHVIPTVLEDILCSHPGVADTAVVGVPDEMDGNHPMAFVVLKPTHQGITMDEIEKYLEDRVDDRRRLRAGVRFVDIIPRTSTGKMNRSLLKEWI